MSSIDLIRKKRLSDLVPPDAAIQFVRLSWIAHQWIDDGSLIVLIALTFSWILLKL